MQITKDYLDQQILRGENTLADLQHQLSNVHGGLNAIRQLRELLDQPEPKTSEAATDDASD